MRRLLMAQLAESGLLAAIALNVTFVPGPCSAMILFFLASYFLAALGARHHIRACLACALLQLAVLWLAFAFALGASTVSADASSEPFFGSPSSLVGLITWLGVTLLPATGLLMGFWWQRAAVRAALRGVEFAT
ncbi:MAG: hypothetical protein QNK04_27230 [Myxococcota bacterium]|nr:hypothetical protein [Myxococcota bacterium]